MKKLIPLIILGLAGGVLAGCGDSPSTVAPNLNAVQGTAEDRAEVAAEAARYPEFMEDALSESADPMSDQLPGTVGALSAQAAIEPITFWRRVRTVDRQFEFAFADTDTTGRPTTAILTVHKDLTGTFNILAQDTTGSFNPPDVVRKPLSERWTRRLEFKRPPSTGDDDDDQGDDDDDGDDSARQLGRDSFTFGNGHGRGHGGGPGGGHGPGRNRPRWELTAVSGIEVGSPEGATEIVSLRFQTSELDTTITDALELLSVTDLPTLAPQTEVTVTATTNASDDIVLLLSRNRRIRLESNGDNTYTGTFVVPESFGCQHFGVTALSHDTLYDDTAPYDSETWLLPIQTSAGALAGKR